jgi:hypothetical protein
MADDADQRSGDDVTEDTEDEEESEVTENEGGEDEGSGDGEEEKVSKSELDRVKARMQAADKAKSAAEAKLREIEQAKLGDLEKAKLQLDEVTKRAEAAEKALRDTQIENAFHRNNKFEFHDVADAISALDLSGVEIDEDGKVSGMEAAIKDVVKRKPHFVKSQKQKDDTGNGTPAANGALNGTRKGDEKQNQATRAALAKRFPVLNK